jgi:hypothetical protein
LNFGNNSVLISLFVLLIVFVLRCRVVLEFVAGGPLNEFKHLPQFKVSWEKVVFAMIYILKLVLCVLGTTHLSLRETSVVGNCIYS